MKKAIIKSIIFLVTVLILHVAAQGASRTHTVQAGETFWGISKKYNVSYTNLRKSNPQITNTSAIRAGQKITIPSAGGTTGTQSVSTTFSEFEEEVIRLVNAERKKRGLSALVKSEKAMQTARIKSQDMAVNAYFSHTSPTYGSPFKMMENHGLRYSAAAENIAKGQKTPVKVMESWMNSSGHRANILSASVTEIGVGATRDKNGTFYWTQLFLNPL